MYNKRGSSVTVRLSAVPPYVRTGVKEEKFPSQRNCIATRFLIAFLSQCNLTVLARQSSFSASVQAGL
jgi:hypothetical protein